MVCLTGKMQCIFLSLYYNILHFPWESHHCSCGRNMLQVIRMDDYVQAWKTMSFCFINSLGFFFLFVCVCLLKNLVDENTLKVNKAGSLGRAEFKLVILIDIYIYFFLLYLCFLLLKIDAWIINIPSCTSDYEISVDVDRCSSRNLCCSCRFKSESEIKCLFDIDFSLLFPVIFFTYRVLKVWNILLQFTCDVDVSLLNF